MPELSGFVCLHRGFLDWEWATEPVMVSVFVRLLLLASFRDTEWRGVRIARGQLITSRENLARQCGISVQVLRTALNRLKSTGEITSQSTNRFTLITVVNYDKYQYLTRQANQQSNPPSNKQITSGQPATNHIGTMVRSITRGRGAAAPALTFDPPGVDEVRSYMLERGYPDEAERFVSTYARQGWRLTNGLLMTDWRAAVDSWQGLPAQQAERAMSDDEWLYR